MSKPFTHLHLHSQYSLLESTITFDRLLDKAKEYGMTSVAVTDNGNMFGAIEFYREAMSKGIKPILGCEVYIAPDGRFQKGIKGAKLSTPQSFPRLVLLAMSEEGYRNLCQLVSRGFTEGFYYRPRIDHELLKTYNKDLIALSSSLFGEVPQTFLNQGPEAALEKIKFYQSIFGDRFYLEIQRNGGATRGADWERVISFYREASKELNCKVVATNQPHYINRDESFAQEVMMCIQSGRTLVEDRRPKLPSDQFDFKSPEAMYKLFSDWPEACENTNEVAERCQLKFKFTDEKGNTIYHLPTFPSREGRTVTDEIRILSEEGLERRYQEAAARGQPIDEARRADYLKRLHFELGVIDKMGFNGYFLIVQDFINYAKNKGIPVGPGRGSGAGSLVAYSLRITDLDPLQHNLLFERFLNPERVSMPDFDIDFCQDRRPEVISYVTEKYGAESVAQIITFGKLQAKAAIRDVGRAMGMTYQEVDVIAKLIPKTLGISLEEAVAQEPKLREAMDSDPKIASLINTARNVEGLTRHASIHAAGVIISDRPLVEHCPMYQGTEGETVVQFDMINAEKIGLIKFDFLGLKTLTMIDNAVKLVRANYPDQAEFSANQISLEDPCIFELLSRGDTLGVFQFEGEGISEFIKKFKPTCFNDLTAINALYRPGPMNMLDEYIARKHGKIEVTYLFPQLENILKETYGIIVYQEQVQLIASACANYSLGEADLLRRAMGKKKPEEMAKQQERFLKGARENNLDLKVADELFKLMAKFAEYGFNKSHAAAYCVVAVQTAYLKAKFPVEFYAALLSTEMSDTDKIVDYIRDARSHKIPVKGPDINRSEFKFSAKNGEIVFGLGAIKGVGEAAVEAILEARNQISNKRFASMVEFFENVDLRRVNKKVIECLIKAGAFDELSSNRAQLYSGFEKYMDAAESKRRDREVGQVSLFQMSDSVTETVTLPEIPEWSRSEKLSNEREVLGFYLSDHPLKGFLALIKNKVSCSIADLKAQPPKKKVLLAGLVSEFKEFITKKGSRMAAGRIEDLSGIVRIVIFPEAYAKVQAFLKQPIPLLFSGNPEVEDEEVTVFVEDIRPVASLADTGKELVIELNSQYHDASHAKKLAEIFNRHKGSIPSRIMLHLAEVGQSVEYEVERGQGISPTEAFFEDMEKTLGENYSSYLI